MRKLFLLLFLSLFSGCLAEPFTPFEEIETIPDPVRLSRQLLSFEDYTENEAMDESFDGAIGTFTGFTAEEDPETGNIYLAAKGVGNITVPSLDLSGLTSLTYSCWLRTYSNNSERLIVQSLSRSPFDTTRLNIVNNRIAAGANPLNDSQPIRDDLFNGEWVMLTVTMEEINVDAPAAGPRIYINGGEPITFSRSSLLAFDPQAPLLLMDRFTGDFDGLKLYEVALSTQEVNSLYQLSKNKYPEKISLVEVPDGLASYYTFEEGDGSLDNISGFDGTFRAEVAFDEAAARGSGRSLLFSDTVPSGTNPILEVPCSILDNVNGFTISFWAKTTDAGYNPLIVQGIAEDPGNNTVAFINGLLYVGNTNYSFNDDIAPNYIDGAWHHFAVTCPIINTSDTINSVPKTLYINGDFIDTAQDSDIDFLKGSSLIIGGDDDGDFFEGSLDNLRIYNRDISAEEVREIFESGL